MNLRLQRTIVNRKNDYAEQSFENLSGEHGSRTKKRYSITASTLMRNSNQNRREDLNSCEQDQRRALDDSQCYSILLKLNTEQA